MTKIDEALAVAHLGAPLCMAVAPCWSAGPSLEER
jgi:hypothetical protein